MIYSPTPGVSAQRTQHRALACQALCPLIGKALDTGKNRLGIEMRFSNDIGFQAASEPLVVPVGGQRIVVGQRPEIAMGHTRRVPVLTTMRS